MAQAERMTAGKELDEKLLAKVDVITLAIAKKCGFEPDSVTAAKACTVEVKIDGTNEQVATRILFESGLPFVVKKGMDEAVRVIIHAVQEIM